MSAKKTKKPEVTFADEVSEVLKKIPVSKPEKSKLIEKIDKLAEKHFK